MFYMFPFSLAKTWKKATMCGHWPQKFCWIVLGPSHFFLPISAAYMTVQGVFPPWNHKLRYFDTGRFKKQGTLKIINDLCQFFFFDYFSWKIFISLENWGQPGCFAYNFLSQLLILYEIYMAKVNARPLETI